MASGGGADVLQVDEPYEFFAPGFFDFMNEETEEEISLAERWFETDHSYAPSPFMPRIKVGRTVQIESLCDFGNTEQAQKDPKPEESSNGRDDPMFTAESTSRHLVDSEVNKGPQELKDGKNSFEFVSELMLCDDSGHPQEENSYLVNTSTLEAQINTQSKEASSFAFPILSSDKLVTPKARMISVNTAASLKNPTASEACTPKAQRALPTKGAVPSSSKNQTTKKITGLASLPSALKLKNQTPSAQCVKGTKPKSKCSGSAATNSSLAAEIAQENQAIKRQKLDRETARQIISIKSRALPHKLKPGLTGGTDLFASATKDCQEAAPFISTAEMVRKFQSSTREINLSKNGSLYHDDTASMIQKRPKLTLTRPKEPELETTHRVRAVRVKSSAELENEMLANIPIFKARPLNKKILEAPSLPALHRSAPQPPEFQEFHLKTMERARQHAETCSVSSTKDPSSQSQSKPLKLTEPRIPHLETAMRARPPKIKSSQELELEELEKMPKFKARPLNKKILESKGDLGLFFNPKPQLTIPQEFHFATNERLGPPVTVMDLFDKLSLHSEPHHDQKEVPQITVPNPFHLHTEERGIEKEKQFAEYILQKQLEEEKARIPKANPYPYTTDYPVIPLKPEPKQCTEPEAFQLESLVRHEEEMQRKLEEKQKMEKEEAQKRNFKAQPILRDDPLPLPERERKPLTEVQEFVLHVDHRAVHRSEFDQKIKEKEMVYKRLRDEYENAKMIEEEKAVKQMRRTMVPHARPLPKFDSPFLPQKSTKETTKPVSPNLHVAQREERRHACHMR